MFMCRVVSLACGPLCLLRGRIWLRAVQIELEMGSNGREEKKRITYPSPLLSVHAGVMQRRPAEKKMNLVNFERERERGMDADEETQVHMYFYSLTSFHLKTQLSG